MLASVIAFIAAGSASQGGAGGSGAAVGELAVTGSAFIPGEPAAALDMAPRDSRAAAPEQCPHARRAVAFYASRIREHAAKMGRPELRGRIDGSPCPRWLAKRLRAKARAWRLRAERFLTLRDFDVRPGYSGWRRAVDEVQRPYPQTKAWLLSCSASEGGWGRWVRHGGGPYYPGLERVDVSGGWAQFKPGTFAGFYRRAVDDVRSRGFRVRRLEALPDGWLSPLAQALAAAWGRVNGLSYHWAGRGC